MQLALSDEVARVLGVGAGDTFEALKADHTVVPVLVTGVFDAEDPSDPVWTARPEILRPRVVGPEQRADDRRGWAAVRGLAPREPAPRSSRTA